MLLAFAQESDLSGALQPQVLSFECHHFADPSAGVVKQKKQGFVADSRVRVEVYRLEQGLHFFFLKVIEALVIGAFAGDGPDPLTLEHQGGFFACHKAKQSTDGRQSQISGSGSAAPFIF